MSQSNDNARDRMPIGNEGLHDILLAADRNDLQRVMEIAAANPEAVNAVWPSIGITPLHIAAANCNVAMIDYLLRYSNLDVAARDAFGRTPLQIAITMGRERTIETLFRATFPENFTDNDPFDRPVIVFPGRRPPEP